MSFRKVLVFSIVVMAIATLISGRRSPEDLHNHIDPRLISSEYDPNDQIGSIDTVQFKSIDEMEGADTDFALTHKTILGARITDKHIEVDLTTQTLKAFEGGVNVMTFPVSTGLWGKTPTGTFHIWGKFRYTKMEGGSKERHTYYYLPNVPYVMFFSNDEIPGSQGFSIHGAYWHNNFGHPMSHGCVNMRVADAGVLYAWANPELPDGKRSTLSTENNPGTEVIIYGVAPAR